MYFRRITPTSGGLSLPHWALPVSYPPGEARSVTDTLVMVWLRGGFGRGAGASSTGFRDQMDCLDDVYTIARASGVTPREHERA